MILNPNSAHSRGAIMRRTFSKEVKRLAWERCQHRCEGLHHDGECCNADLRFRAFHFDHRIRWELTRDSSLENCQVLCVICHRRKTAHEAAPIAKADRQADFHAGLTGPGKGCHPLPADRNSNVTKKLNGKVESRLPRYGKHHRAMAEFPNRRPQ